MMRIRFLFGCFLAFGCLLPGLRAQDTAFWFVAPHMSEQLAAGVPLNRPAFLAISNGTYQTANVRITRYNGTSASIFTNVTIAPGALYKLDFTTDAEMKTIENPRGQAGSVTEFGMHIYSDVKVTAYYMHNHTDSRDIFTLKGHQALGTSFYVPMQSDNLAQTGNYTGACDQIDIVATEDDTEVTVIPKATIRIGASGSSNANAPISKTLQKGQTLKIMEYTPNSGSLTGTSITTNNKPVAVTVTEDLVGGDTSGDQIVPVSSLGTRYIVPKGYKSADDRFYMVGTAANTTVKVYYSGSTYAPYTLNAGTAGKYTFPTTNVNAVYVEATAPIYIYQRSGYGEEGAALIPSVYSIGQTQMAYFQVPGQYEKGFLVFRSGKQAGFTISYGSTTTNMTDLPGFAVSAVPNNITDWQIARFDLPSAANSQVVTIRNSQSPFSFGYMAANASPNNMGCYGYFSAFGTFEFPDTTYMCSNAVTIEGGYARSYLWTYPDGVTTATTPSINVSEEGEYTLVMDQDPNIITATTYVRKVYAGTVGPAEQVICTGTAPAVSLTVTGASELTGTTYQWQSSPDGTTGWSDIAGATSATYTPGTLTSTTYYRRGMTSDLCAMAYTYAVRVKVSSCTLPVNPHLMGRFRTGN
ncbi:MAG: IgGFc-binding protein [Tannerellaceae bacterium]|jgi:hypothetical protein|nr:IgGFc-binding protein [Tannerellaceae bacterium]